MTCISGRRAVIGFKVTTSQRPVREIVRPAWPVVGLSVTKLAQRTKNAPKSAVCGVLGEFCTGLAQECPVLGEFCTGLAFPGLRPFPT